MLIKEVSAANCETQIRIKGYDEEGDVPWKKVIEDDWNLVVFALKHFLEDGNVVWTKYSIIESKYMLFKLNETTTVFCKLQIILDTLR